MTQMLRPHRSTYVHTARAAVCRSAIRLPSNQT